MYKKTFHILYNNVQSFKATHWAMLLKISTIIYAIKNMQ